MYQYVFRTPRFPLKLCLRDLVRQIVNEEKQTVRVSREFIDLGCCVNC